MLLELHGDIAVCAMLKVTDEGIKNIAASCKNLSEINLGYTQVSPPSWHRHLAMFHHVRSGCVCISSIAQSRCVTEDDPMFVLRSSHVDVLEGRVVTCRAYRF